MKKALNRIQHPKPKRPQYAPHRWSVPVNGKTPQTAQDPEKSNLLDKKATTIIQSIVGTMLNYARSVDPTMLRVISKISRVQSRPTRDTNEKAIMLLDYAAMYPDIILRYKSSNMVLQVDSDAAYLTMSEARTCYAGHLYLRDSPSSSPIKTNPERNGPINIEYKTIHNVVSSTAESETCGTFNNRKTSIDIRPDIITFDHKQPETPLKMNNSTTEGFVNSGMKPKRSKTWDLKWHWLREK